MVWTSTIPDHGSPSITPRRQQASQVTRAARRFTYGKADLSRATTAGPHPPSPTLVYSHRPAPTVWPSFHGYEGVSLTTVSTSRDEESVHVTILFQNKVVLEG